MKLSDLRPCDNCGGKIAPMFYFGKISLAVFNPTHTNQTLGLMQFFGGGNTGLIVAEAMGASPDVVKIAGDEEPALWSDIFICMECIAKPISIGYLLEKISDARKRDDDATTS